MTTVAPARVRESASVVRPALKRALARLDPTSRAIASYHLGWTDPDGRPQEGGGKAVRPALALLSARAAGATLETGLPGAVAVELVHNFSLLHDDLMDGDLERRHRPTVWALWGGASAILTGDALLVLAQQVLLDLATAEGAAAARLLADATQELVRGQAEDVAFEERPVVGVEQCLTMAAGKTGALLSASASIGAVLAGAPGSLCAALAAFGRELGLAFQLVDDLLGIWGDPAVTGKPVLSDLRTGKKTLPVTWALAHGGAAGIELADWLAAGTARGEEQLRRAADLVERAGGRAWAAAEAARRLAYAEQALLAAPVPADACGDLVALGRFVVGREC
jgi:geranylgeranyl diphosphate synthase type I